MDELREPISEVLVAEAGAWVTMVRSTLDYCLAIEKVPPEIREKLQVYRPNLGEFVATGEQFKYLSLNPAQLNQVVLLIREPFDHQDLRRAAKGSRIRSTTWFSCAGFRLRYLNCSPVATNSPRF